LIGISGLAPAGFADKGSHEHTDDEQPTEN
jgi:hypothetical protein